MKHPLLLKYRLEYLLLRATVAAVNLLPLPIINGLTSSLARLVWICYPFRLPVVYDNITTIFPSMSHTDKLALAKSAYRQFFSAAGLILVIQRNTLKTLIDDAHISGLHHLDQALSQKKGVILTTYHGCWFEAYFAWFSRGSRPTSLIYQQQSNPLCDAFFVKHRQRYGRNLEHINSLEKLKVYEKALQQGRILIISLDQNYTDNGTPVRLFDTSFTCARGTALLHLRTGAPVLTSVYFVKNGRLHIEFEPVNLPHYPAINDQAIEDISNRAIKGYEKTIRAYPDQWFSLFHRLWKKIGYPTRIKRSFSDLLTTKR
jgi:Kdo2-lipid IVA lauroyltransferase/acyltransferase